MLVFVKVNDNFGMACQIKCVAKHTPLARSMSNSEIWRDVTNSQRWPQNSGYYKKQRITDTKWKKIK